MQRKVAARIIKTIGLVLALFFCVCYNRKNKNITIKAVRARITTDPALFIERKR